MEKSTNFVFPAYINRALEIRELVWVIKYAYISLAFLFLRGDLLNKFKRKSK